MWGLAGRFSIVMLLAAALGLGAAPSAAQGLGECIGTPEQIADAKERGTAQRIWEHTGLGLARGGTFKDSFTLSTLYWETGPCRGINDYTSFSTSFIPQSEEDTVPGLTKTDFWRFEWGVLIPLLDNVAVTAGAGPSYSYCGRGRCLRDREWRLDTSLGLAATLGRQGIWRRVGLSTNYDTLTERFTLSVLFLDASDRNTDIRILPEDIWD